MIVLNSPFQEAFNRQLLPVAMLYLLVILSALAVIYLKHFTRITHAKLQKQVVISQGLVEEKGKLLLEKSTFTADARVEQVAREQLNMRQPKQILMIGPK